jgi:hypothetical protein
MIQSFSFGQITIEGTTYHSDVIIYPDHVQAEWWRSEGHRLQKEDVKKIVETCKPDTLMVGTGYGGLKVPAETASYIKSMGIELITGKTENICERYNELSPSQKVIAALHLTC